MTRYVLDHFGMDGQQSPSNPLTMSIVEATTITAVYNAVTHVLSVSSSPNGIPFTIIIGGIQMSYVTPWDSLLDEGIYELSFPAQISIAGMLVRFGRWEDASTNPVRQLNLLTDTSITATYPVGTLVISTTPVAAAIMVDGVSVGSGSASILVEAGSQHVVSFGDVSGYVTPPPQTVTVAENGTRSIVGTYTLAPPTQGILSVDTTPVKGVVYVDGVLWGVAPVSASIDAGVHNVSFGQVSGYTPPPTITVNVVAGTETPVLGTYVEIPPPPPTQGTLAVNTTPVSGQIFVNGQSWGMSPQFRQLDPGLYLVSFGDVAGYVKPTNITANVVAGEETDVTGVYTVIPPPTLGVLSVDTTPVKGEVLVNGSSWGTAPQSRQVETGSYLVSFGDVTGYTKPSDYTAVVTADMETTVMGTYTPIPIQQGILSTRVYYDTMEVVAPVEVVGVGSYMTPIQLPLNPGTYTINATYQSQQQTKNATVISGQTTDVDFQFTSIPPPPPPPPQPPPEPVLPNVRKILYPIVPGVFDRWDERRRTGAQS